VEVRIPTSITPRQEELLHEFVELEKDKDGNKGKKWPWNRRKQPEKDSMSSGRS
jgi:hypothetical protein